MANPYFKFKKFTVFQDKCAMKVGVDGVLLGAWTPLENSIHILDVGTGTGLISMMLAQRSNAFIDAIDIDKQAILQAQQNINSSPWRNRIQLSEISFQEYVQKTASDYDLIVSNPPYFVNSLKAPSASRTQARHADTLFHSELIELGNQILKPTGNICLILPVKEGLKCYLHALELNMGCQQVVFVYPRVDLPAKRLLLHFSKKDAVTRVSKLVIETRNRHQYTPEFNALVSDFYLNL